MCFSAEVSFVSAGVLAIAGGVSAKKAIPNSRYFLLAVTPFIFGIQQFLEGMVWMGVNHQDAFLMNTFSAAYLFFAFCFWLVWFPMVAYSLEAIKWKKSMFLALVVIGVIFGLYTWLPVFFGVGPRKLIDTSVCGKSLCYNFASGGIVPGLAREYIYALLAILYVFCSDTLFRKFWLIVLTAAAITIMVQLYAIASVWCFFSGMASIYIIYLLDSTNKATNETFYSKTN